nr:flavodoxin [uncultured Dysosmobacter sp.]
MSALVIYYSYSGNTRRAAERIGKAIGADLAEIQTVRPYTGSYDDVVDQGQREVDSGFLPELRPLGTDLSRYDTIILGTPVWWYTFAPAMNSFLHSADLSGKTVYPFATNGGWLGHTFRDFEKACRGAQVKAGLDIRFNGDRQMTPDTDIQKWLKNF